MQAYWRFPQGIQAELRFGKNNRPICLHLGFQRKRSTIKRIGRLLSAYLVQSVHARTTPWFQTSYFGAGIKIGQIRRQASELDCRNRRPARDSEGPGKHTQDDVLGGAYSTEFYCENRDLYVAERMH